MKKSSNYIWNSVGYAINSFSSLFYLVIVTRINGIENAGIFSFLYTLSIILFTICQYGGRTYQVSDINSEFKDKDYFNSKHITCIIGLIITIIYILISKFNTFNSLILLILVVIRIIEAYSDVIYAVFQKNDRLDYIGKSLVIKITISLIYFLIIDMYFKNIIISLIGSLFGTILVFLLYDLRKMKKFDNFKLELDLKTTKKILFTMKYFCLFSIVTLVIINMPRWFVNSMLNDNYQGYFSIIMMIPTGVAMFGQFILQPNLVELSKNYNSKKYNKMEKDLKNILLGIFGICIICLLCAYFLGPWALNLVYGIEFYDYRLALLLVVIGGMFYIFSIVYSNMLTIMRKTKLQFYIYIVIMIIGLIINYLLIKKFEFYGPFISYIFVMLINSIIFYIYYKKELRK